MVGIHDLGGCSQQFIPGEMRACFQEKLFYLGVDDQRIMGGLDGLCRRLEHDPRRWNHRSGESGDQTKKQSGVREPRRTETALKWQYDARVGLGAVR
jgi:hypothetical protein